MTATHRNPTSTFLRLVQHAQPAWLALSWTIFFGAGTAILTVIQAKLASQVISKVFLFQANLETVRPLLIPLLGAIFLRALFTGAGEISAPRMAARVKIELRDVIYAKIVRLGPHENAGERTGELTADLQEGVEALEGFYSQYLPQLGLAALIPLTILGTVFPLDRLSGLILLLTAPLIPLFMILIGNLAEGLTQRQWAALGNLSAHYLDTIQGLTTLKQLGSSRRQADALARSGERYRQATLEVLRVSFLSALTLELIATLSTALLAVSIGLRLLKGGIGYEQALLILILAPEFYQPLRTLGQHFHAGAGGLSAARRLFALLDTPAPPSAQSAALTVPTASLFPLRFHHVSFSYAEDQSLALKDIDLSIQAGQQVALVGATGSGKSTLMRLILRFIQPTSGQIFAGEQPLEEIPPTAWRQQIAWVSPQPYLFHDTLAANLRLAKPEASLDELRAAARLARLDDWIISLPSGYETSIGEEGARLSAGQRQRLALARAFLKNAPFLLLDEPTANLDPVLEAELKMAVEQLMSGRTVLTIAHRLSTITQADLIVVLEAGQIVESGRHAQLCAQSGPYQRLVNASNRTGAF